MKNKKEQEYQIYMKNPFEKAMGKAIKKFIINKCSNTSSVYSHLLKLFNNHEYKSMKISKIFTNLSLDDITVMNT